MKISNTFPSSYIKVGDLQGTEVPVVIERVAVEEVGDGNKPVVYFVGKKKGLVCNKTNAETISESYGDETDDWLSRHLVLYPDKTMFNGKRVPCIRVKVPGIEEQGADGDPGF